MEYVFIVLGSLIIGAIIGYFIARTRTVAAETMLNAKQAECERIQDEARTAREELQGEISSLRTDREALADNLAEKKAEAARLSEQLRQESEERAKIRRESELAFREIATTIIDERSKGFKEANERRLDEILKPFKDDVAWLQQSIQKYYTDEVVEVKSLKESIKMLAELNASIGREAKELAVALKGNSKTQGDWGEFILKGLLEKSGLQEGVNYTLQATTANGEKIVGDEGNLLRPDAIFHLPEGKNLIIDSKVSISAYIDYVNSTDDEARAHLLKEHIASVRRHIIELSNKRYDHYVKDAAEFVLMFIPSEPAYMLAMSSEPHLWDEAYAKRIVIISPTHLLTVLKLMTQLWLHDKQTKNAIAIANETGKLLDKFSNFVKDLEDIGIAIKKASEKYTDAMNKLQTGNGNILKRIHDIKVLGVKTSKSLPQLPEAEDEIEA